MSKAKAVERAWQAGHDTAVHEYEAKILAVANLPRFGTVTQPDGGYMPGDEPIMVHAALLLDDVHRLLAGPDA